MLCVFRTVGRNRISTHGLSGYRHLVFGSVAKKVIYSGAER